MAYQSRLSPSNTVVCLENTGIYDDQLLQVMHQAGWICAVEHTRVLEKVTPQHHRKDDGFDAAKLAEYGYRYLDELHLFRPTRRVIKGLRQLFNERRRLVGQRASVKTKQTQSRQLTVTSSLVEQSWQAQMNCYNHQIQAIEQRIRDLIHAHAPIQQYDEVLQRIPGVGEVTSWMWIIQFYGESQLDARSIASRFGFAPHTYRSGSSAHGKTRSSGHGVSQMRQYMSMAVRSACTHCNKFRSYKEQKEIEGKNWPVIRNNTINKLIKIMCAIWNSKSPYQKNHTSRFDQQKNAA